MLRYECHRNSPWCEEGEKAFFVPTACFLAQARHHTAHYKRRAPTGETARLGLNFWREWARRARPFPPKIQPLFKA